MSNGKTFDVHSGLSELWTLSIVVNTTDLVTSIDQKACLSINSAHIDTWREHKLVCLIDLRHDRLLILEEEHKFDESHSIVAYDFICLSFLWSNFHFFGF